MITTTKAQVISEGRITILEDWVNSLGLDEGTSVDLFLSGDKIIIEKARHPLEDMCSLLDDIEFTDSDHKQAKKSLFHFRKCESGRSDRRIWVSGR
ncbi:MAG: AbrB/MazE/SpoVT family DNA-binding domain-containing protein [Euryarchaeota archaeon]|nr:AbrB/MazE/SpoVT family DNA-binding domain-containing protein [Euryarchaeota archaeon]